MRKEGIVAPKEGAVCLNCDTALVGGFCHECGQKNIDLKAKSLRFILTQFAGALYFIDNKFFRSFRDFILKPGKLSRTFIEGKRNRYISPISLFLLVNLVFFLFSTVTDFNLSLVDQVTLQPYSKISMEMVRSSIEKMGITSQEYTNLYTIQSANLSKTIIILNLPLFALLIHLFNIRKKKYYYIDHFIFATHTLSIVLTLFTVVFSLGSFVEFLIGPYFPSSVMNYVFQVTIGFTGVLYLIYSFISFKRTYETGVFETILATVYLGALYLFINYWHRMILFLFVWATI